MGDTKRLLHTVEEAAEILRVGRSTLYDKVKAAAVPCRLMPNGQYMFTEADLDQILNDAYRPKVA